VTRSGAQWPQPQAPPQQPPPEREGPAWLGVELGFAAPWTAKVENCFNTFAAPHSGQTTA